jgi:site-specific DNA-methyltransferase (adenine-specific)
MTKTPISEVFLEDCMLGMARYPDKFFDLAIVDPPYGIGIVAPGRRNMGVRRGTKTLTKYKSANWDTSIPEETYFTELFRVSKNQIIWGANYFSHFLPGTKGWVVWDKHQPAGVSFAQAELAFTSFNSSIKIFECSRAKIGNSGNRDARTAAVRAKIHPTQKPVVLYQWLLDRYAHGGDKILDTHMGSQSSRIAAYNMGFNYWGWEIDAEYFEAGNKRFKEQTAQLSIL